MQIKSAIVVLLLISGYTCLHAQKYKVSQSEVRFFSDAAIEDITATTTRSSGLVNFSSAEFAFVIPVKEFEFEKSLMKEHFNEKYMETEKFPQAVFSGKIDAFDPSAAGRQSVTAKGKLTIHGVAKDVSIPATIERKDGSYHIDAVFVVKLADHKIRIPQLLWQNIAEQVEVKVNFVMVPQ